MQSDRFDNPDVPPVHVARPRPYRSRRAMWGIGALAVSPEAIPEGPRRKRLVRAATLTSAMGLAWASGAGGAPPSDHATTFDHLGMLSAATDDGSMRLSSPLPGPWQEGADTPSSEAEVVRAPDDTTSAPGVANQKARKREQASEVTAKREARPTEDQGLAKGADAENGRKRPAARGKGDKKAVAADGAGKGAGTQDAGRKEAGKQGAGKRAKAVQADRKPEKVSAAQESRRISAAPEPDAWRTNVVASHEEVDFVQMSDKTVLVGFHEAAMPGAKPLAVAATPDANHGRGKVPFSPGDDPLHTMILPTRARTTNAASAMDVVIPAREAVFAPVTGTVAEVDHYQLYGTYPDNRLVIVPDARPDLRVVMLHVEGVKVGVGDKVAAGQTKLAVGANPFTFESQIDRFARPLMKGKGQATPHVHVELR